MYVAAVSNQGLPPIPLVKKKWLPRDKIQELTALLIEEDGCMVFREGPSRHHPIRGFGLVANKPWVQGAEWQYLYPACVTLDMMLSLHREQKAAASDDLSSYEHGGVIDQVMMVGTGEGIAVNKTEGSFTEGECSEVVYFRPNPKLDSMALILL